MTIVRPEDAITTVFCAVWSGDPNREALLRGHQENLERLRADVAAIYVFDSGDRAPPGVRGQLVHSADPLTIYQAWNVATQVATTRNVMNLNLDDRLAPRSIRFMEAALDANDAQLAAGDWNVAYSQADTDDVGEHLLPTAEVPFRGEWPPSAGCQTRLGSGTGERGTFGPGVMWRRDLHDRAPYPCAFASGDPIKSVGDLAWWLLAQRHLGARVLRLPVIIGNYFSHPSEQAEFRFDDEMEAMNEGVQAINYPVDGLGVEISI